MKGKKLLVSLLAAVVLMAVMVTPVMAAGDGTVISGTVPVVIEVVAPDDITGLDLTPLSSPVTSGAHTATVKCNKAGWTLTVVETAGDGKMALTVSPNTPLTNAMKVNGGDLGITYTALSGTEVTLEDGSGSVVGTTNITDINFQQAVEWVDAAGDYSITVTFTATAATP